MRLAMLFLLLVPGVDGKNCKKGKPCGNTCISRSDTCRTAPSVTSSAPAPRAVAPAIVSAPRPLHLSLPTPYVSSGVEGGVLRLIDLSAPRLWSCSAPAKHPPAGALLVVSDRIGSSGQAWPLKVAWTAQRRNYTLSLTKCW